MKKTEGRRPQGKQACKMTERTSVLGQCERKSLSPSCGPLPFSASHCAQTKKGNLTNDNEKESHI